MHTEYKFEELNDKYIYEDSVENVKLEITKKSASADLYYFTEPSAPDFDEIIKTAMSSPYGTPPLRKIAKGKQRVAIIVSDATRAVQTPKVLPYIISELEEAGITTQQIRIVVAIGVHRNATQQEMEDIAGIYKGIIKVENHDPYTHSNLCMLGTTSFGTPVQVNKDVYDSDLRISIGKIEPHEFAGFSGGRKSVLPGVSSEACIIHNHRPEMILNPNAVAGVLKENPVHMDMLETAKMLGIDFTVNLVQNVKGEPVGVFAGDLEEAHVRGVEFVNRHFGVSLKDQGNIYLVTPGKPLNIDLYQSVKSLIALTSIVKAGDAIVFYSKCAEGVNSVDMVEPFNVSTNLDEVLKYVTENYKIQMDHTLLLCKLYQKGVKVLAYVPGVEKEILSLMHMTPANSLQEAMQNAIDWEESSSNSHPKIAVIPTPQRAIIKQGN